MEHRFQAQSQIPSTPSSFTKAPSVTWPTVPFYALPAKLIAFPELSRAQVKQGPQSLHTKPSLFCHFSTLELEEMLYCRPQDQAF